jgi:hypothetical protein
MLVLGCYSPRLLQLGWAREPIPYHSADTH